MREFIIPTIIESPSMSEKTERQERHLLAKTIKNGKGKFKIRTSSGAFNEFIVCGQKK